MKRTVAPRVKRNRRTDNAKVKRGKAPDFRGELLKPDQEAPKVNPPPGNMVEVCPWDTKGTFLKMPCGEAGRLPSLPSLEHARRVKEETVAIKRLALEERDYDRELGKADAPDWCDGLGWTTARPIREGLYLTRWDDKCPVRAVKVTSEPGFLAVVAGSIGIWPVTDAAGIWLGPIPWPDGKPEVPA